MEDLHLLERLAQEEMDRQDIEDARAALKEAKKTGTIPSRAARKLLGL
jgi:L-fucose isomerase-like protein